MSKELNGKIHQDFAKRRTLQIVMIGAAFFLVLLLAAMHKRPDLFGNYSRHTLAAAQILVGLAFINLTALNWRCPKCRRYLGNNLSITACRHCGTRLK